MLNERVPSAFATGLAVVVLLFLGLLVFLGAEAGLPYYFYGVACVALGVAAARLTGRVHVLLQMAAAGLPAAGAAFLLPVPPLGRYIAMGVGAVLAVSVEHSAVVEKQQSTVTRLLSPLLALLVCGCGAWINGLVRHAPQTGAWAALAVTGSVWLAVALFLLNRYSVRDAARARAMGQVPAAVRRTGLAGTVALLALAFVLACLAPIGRGVAALFRLIGVGIAALMRWLAGGPQTPPPTPMATATDAAQRMPQMAGGSAGILAQIINFLMTAIGIALVLLAVGYGLYKGMPRLWAALTGHFKTLFTTWRDDSADDYRDRAETLMSLRQALAQAGDQFTKFTRRFRRRPRLEDFATNGERVRFLFREFLQALAARGRAPAPGATADEIVGSAAGGGGFARAYDRARYGGEEPDDGAVAEARRFVQGK